MSEIKHTPGPWFTATISPECDTQLIMAKRTNGACGVAEVYLPPYPEGGEANAHMVAASPDMYDLLMELYDWFDDRSDAETLPDQGDVPNEEMEWAARIREVLAKARGS